MPPDPPRLRGLTAPCTYGRLLLSNQLPTSNFIETPDFFIRLGFTDEVKGEIEEWSQSGSAWVKEVFSLETFLDVAV